MRSSDTRKCARCKRTMPATLEFFTRRYDKRYKPSERSFDSWCRDCRRQNRRDWGLANKAELNGRRKQKRDTERLAVLQHYGGTPPTCACCGETTVQFLAIDHINSGGTAHRKAVNVKGQSFTSWLVRQGLPAGFRILCHNCNFAEGLYGSCPHNAGGANHGIGAVAYLTADEAARLLEQYR